MRQLRNCVDILSYNNINIIPQFPISILFIILSLFLKEYQ